MKNKKMKPFIILLAGTLMVSLSGCGNTIPSLSEEQEALVVEYASTAVLKHDANYQGKLVDLSTLKNEEETPVEETMQAPAEEADIPKEPEQMQEPQQEQDIQIQPGTVRVKIIMNGEEENALTTMLLNDLATYQGTLGPNEETELVVVGEYPVEDLQTIDSLSVKLKNESGEVVLNCD